MEFDKIIETRRAIRSYDSKPVSDAELDKIFRQVSLAPSSYNLQPWEFIVVRDAAQKRKLRACAQDQKHVEECSVAIIALANTDPMHRAEEVFEDRLKRGYYTAEQKERSLAKVAALASESAEKRAAWAIRSASLACMTLMYAARNLGLDTCPMEGFSPDDVRREFRIPNKYEIVMLITLGHRKGEPLPRLKKYPPESFLHSEEYGK